MANEKAPKLNDYDVIKFPLLTEKTTDMGKNGNTYVFCVGTTSTKIQVKEAIERLFSVKVDNVRTCNYQGKTKRTMKGTGRTVKYKKAYVTLREGDKIDSIVEGL